MGIKNGVRPNITRTRPDVVAVQPIPRDRDNTDDLQQRELEVHSKFKVDYPDNKVRKGSFDSSSNAAYNGNTITAPPQ